MSAKRQFQRALLGFTALACVGVSAGIALAADEQDIIDRIKPVGEVCIEGQPCPVKAVPAAVIASEPVAEPASSAETAAATETAVQEEAPAAEAQATAAAPAPSSGRSGADVYNSSCAACHGTGLAGAPKPGDAAGWEPRLAQGKDTVLQHAINGLRAMPPRGACAACTDEEIQAAIDHMTAGIH